MHTRPAPGQSRVPAVDITVALTVRAWCDRKFAADYEADPEQALMSLLREQGLDAEGALHHLIQLPVSPIGEPEAVGKIYAASTWDWACETQAALCTQDLACVDTSQQICDDWTKPGFCYTEVGSPCETYDDVCLETLGCPN